MAIKTSAQGTSGPAQPQASQSAYSRRSGSARMTPMYPKVKPKKRPCHLLKLPRELRDMIYEFASPQKFARIVVDTRSKCAKLLSTLDLQVLVPCWELHYHGSHKAIGNHVRCLFSPPRSLCRMKKLYHGNYSTYRSGRTPPMSLNALPWRSIEVNFGFIDDWLLPDGLDSLGRTVILPFLLVRLRRAKIIAEVWSDDTGPVRLVCALRSEDVVAYDESKTGGDQPFAELRDRIVDICSIMELPIKGVSVEQDVQRTMK
ncbi:hypothetical protein CBER1_10708 [Cercospora berteroae]|uniref:Uncharacterized protein n=1 Tax=Cercospora berteroae TaxID=357750 RepID=A0A2S6BYE5_9PEZI|nr:hypothetical protein CBER1_10708 [Cercospora berteroae]